MKTILFTSLAVLAIAFFTIQRAQAMTPPTEAKALVLEGATLIDVRTPAEFASGHIDGAKNIPVQEVPKRMAEFGLKDSKIVVYCKSGGRSGQAKKLLEAAGYTAVFNLGAMSAWPTDSE